MAPRYTPEQLLFLKDSPLVKKPDNLPPSDEWMGPVPDPNSGRLPSNRVSERHTKGSEGPLFDQTNRRPATDRHSRGSANPEDIILGPPKTAFTSSTSIRNSNRSLDISERTVKDGDSTRRFGLHAKLGDIENDRNAGRDGRRVRRADGDQDTEGWSTVKPRKSFGAEGAERMFNGRMGGERHKDERRPRDSHDKDHKDRPARGFDNYSREKDADHDHDDTPRKERNGIGRGRNEPTWFKDSKDEPPSTGRNGNRHVDSNRGWREKERDDGDNKGGEKGDRRWNRDKDQRQERDPEWMAEADDEKKQTPHTMEDFEKWKKLMKASNGDTPADEVPSRKVKNTQPESNGFEPGSFFGPEPPKVDTPLGIEIGPDKFFGQWAGDKKEKSSGDSQQDEILPKPQPIGKSSRFKSFFAAPPSEEPLGRVNEPPPAKELAQKGDLGSLFGNKSESSSEDKEAFAALLQKLQSQSTASSHSTPPINTNPPPPPVTHEARPQSATAQQMSDPFIPYHQERQEEQRRSSRNSQQHLIDLLNQKQSMHTQQPNHSSIVRPEQMVQEIMSQRQGAPSHTAGRPESQSRDPNSDFMLSLMQGPRAPPQQQQPMLSRRESQNAERQLRQQLEHEAQLASQQQQQFEREQREQRELRDRRLLQAQRQARKQELSPGYYDEQMMQGNFTPQPMEQQRNVRPQQPTQILQRPPPGLDNGGMPPPNWGGPPNQQQPPQVQSRHIGPPPGLPGGGGGGMLPMSMQQNMQNLNLNQSMGIVPPPLNSAGFPGPAFMHGGFEGVGGGIRGVPLPPPPPPGFFPPPLPGFMQQQQQGRGGMGGGIGMAHGGYEGAGGQGVAFLQGQIFDGRTGPQGPQGQPFRR